MKKDNIQKWALRELLKTNGARIQWMDYNNRTWLSFDGYFMCGFYPRELKIDPQIDKVSFTGFGSMSEGDLPEFIPTGVLIKNPKRGGYLHELRATDNGEKCYVQDIYYKHINAHDVSFRGIRSSEGAVKILEIYEGVNVEGFVSVFNLKNS